MDSLQAAQRSVRFLAYGYSYSSNAFYKATTGRKMKERHFAGYVLLVPAVSWPDIARACVPHPWCVVGVQRFIFSSCTTASAPGSCTNPISPPNTGIYPRGSLRWAGQTFHSYLFHQWPSFPWIFPWTVEPFISPAKLQPPLADSEDSPSPMPCACSLLLIPCSGQAQSLFQIGMLLGSVCSLPSCPSGCGGSGNSPTR